MGIYGGEYEEDEETKTEYRFTYIDRVFDDYLSMGIKPFVEIGFMPNQLASGTQTVFYWKGNVTPPKDYTKWTDLVQATLRHWIERYGREEVVSWFFEIWNEPNLKHFWENADEEEYFKLYHQTAIAVKEVDSEFRVGGPAICGVDDERWLKVFLDACIRNHSPIDFVSRHVYTTEYPEFKGHYAYQGLRNLSSVYEELDVSRSIIDSYEEYRGMDMHITEFSTSYTPKNPLHDSTLNAAYIAKLLSWMGKTCASYSYWTFGDVFEENGIPYTLFHGGFGLLANGGIPKPTYHTFRFYKKLGNVMMDVYEYGVISKSDRSSLRGILWNPVISKEDEEEVLITYPLDEMEEGEYFLLTETVSEEYANPREVWHQMGMPTAPTKEQTEVLQKAACPLISTKRISVHNKTGKIEIQLKKNQTTYFELSRVNPIIDRGYLLSDPFLC
jgi:xylan 1,4-beta-xylosidase